MKFRSLPLLPLFLLPSCGSDYSERIVYLAAKYRLTFAAVVPDYILDMSPYFTDFKRKQGYVDYISSFDKQNSIVNIETKIDMNNEPFGVGSIDIKFSDPSIISLSDSYTYYCSYDGVYGGSIIISEDTKPSYIGSIMFRSRTWWVRMEAWFPVITEERLILEFEFYETNDEPEEFDHKIW